MISFILPAHNEERLIGAALDAIHEAASGLTYEIVVVDDASTDGTAAIAAAGGARVVPVALRQIGAVRNAGAAAARGEVFFFVDADTRVNRAVVQAALAALEAGAVGGGARVRWDGPLPWWARALDRFVVLSMRVGRWAAGCFIFCRRDAFEAAGGFDRRVYAAEEIYFSWALKRHGRLVVLRESVLTSARKLQTHSLGDLLRLFGHMVRRGPAVVRDRQHLDIWYGKRRHDE